MGIFTESLVMNFILELFPVVVFFIAFKIGDIYLATGVLMGAAILQIALLKVFRKEITKTHWFGLVLILGFGSLTFFFQDEAFIKLKVTILVGAFGLALLLSNLLFKKNILKGLLEAAAIKDDSIKLKSSSRYWSLLNFSWSMLFLVIGAANYYIAYNMPTEYWVNFKVIGVPFITFVALLATVMTVTEQSEKVQ